MLFTLYSVRSRSRKCGAVGKTQLSLRDRVVARPAAGTAARESFQRKPTARQRAVPLDSLVSVVRAGRLIPAGSWQNAREGRLVASYQSEEEPFHGGVLCFAEFRASAAMIAADNCVTDA